MITASLMLLNHKLKLIRDLDTEDHVSTDASNQALTRPITFSNHDPASYIGRHLSDDDGLQLLTSSLKLPPDYELPVTCGRFNPSWLVNRPWLRYSIKNNGIYCIYCVCFCDSSESPFVTSGFRNWKKALGKKLSYIEQHKRNESHKVAEERMVEDTPPCHRYWFSVIRAGC